MRAPQDYSMHNMVVKNIYSYIVYYSKLSFLFFLPKMVIYLIPIAIAMTSSRDVYGIFEISISISTLIYTTCLSPLTSGLMHFGIMHNIKLYSTERLVYLCKFVGTISFAFTILAHFLGLPSLFLMISTMVFFLILQAGCATYARIESKPILTAWSDGLSTLCFAVLLIPHALGFDATSVDVIFCLVALQISILISSNFWPTGSQKFSIGDWSTIFRTGQWMAIVAISATWLSVSGRLIFGAFFPGNIEEYSYAFRICGSVLIFHQMVSTLLFAKLYKIKATSFDKFISKFIILFCMSAILICICFIKYVYFFSSQLYDFDKDILIPISKSFPLLFIGISGFGWLQFRISRYQLSRNAIFWLMPGTLFYLFIILGLTLALKIGAIGLSWLVSSQASIAFFIAWFVLARSRILLWRTLFAFIIGNLACLSLLVF